MASTQWLTNSYLTSMIFLAMCDGMQKRRRECLILDRPLRAMV